MSFILFIFFFALIIFLMALSFGISILRGILSIFIPSLRRKANAPFGQGQNYYGQRSSNNDSSGKKKIIDPNEGDYADYEEIKN